MKRRDRAVQTPAASVLSLEQIGDFSWLVSLQNDTEESSSGMRNLLRKLVGSGCYGVVRLVVWPTQTRLGIASPDEAHEVPLVTCSNDFISNQCLHFGYTVRSAGK